MKQPITVLVSACGAPGTAALLRALRENGEREVRLVGTDMRELAIGRHLADAFHRVPARLRPRLRRRDARGLPRARASTPSCRSRRSTCSASPRRRTASRASPCSSPRRRRSAARTTRPRPTRCSTGSACAGPAWRRVARRRGGRRGRPRARLPGRRRLHEAGVLVRLARVPRPLGVGRPARAAAHEPARRRGGAAARGPARAARRRPDRAPRDGARDRQGADDRRDRGRGPDRARPSEDARGDARRARDVLRDARRPRR